MNTLTKDQKIALMVVPVLLFGVLGISYASAQGRNLTDEQMDAVMEARDLRESGNFDEAKEVLKNAGIEKGDIFHKGPRHERRAAIKEAIEADDYAAFQKAVEGTVFGETMTEDVFEILVEAHELHEAGDHEAARQLLIDNDIKRPGHVHRHVHW